MNILRYVCGYHNVEIRERECHNVVATAILNFGLCPEMLKDRYPFVRAASPTGSDYRLGPPLLYTSPSHKSIRGVAYAAFCCDCG